MARPKKQIVDYFPHNCNHGKTIFILQNKYGNDGYAFWFKLLELLGQSEGHVYDCNNPSAWEFLLAKTLVSEELALKILQTLADLEAIDTTAWTLKIIWSHNFVENLDDVYVRRKCKKPEFPASLLDYYRQKTPLSETETPLNGISVNINPQSKVKYSKVKYSIVKENKTSFVPTQIEFGLSKLLLDKIIERKPDYKKPDLQKWARYIDLMIRIDKRDPKKISQIIEWCQADDFWQNVILSTEKLRKQFDKIDLKMRSDKEYEREEWKKKFLEEEKDD
ncbi:MAG: hypothetical protein DDT19_00227 [Syntrophomonadaceae bacterium]|nr:hypothetical protein [Bacillota bacterium]